MMISDLEIGQNILVLRYSLNIRKTIIEDHKEVIDSEGFCWFGKMGSVTSNHIIDAVLAASKPAIVLYKKGHLYLCSFEAITTNKPQSGIPTYYESEYVIPSCYFKLTEIEEAPLELLEHLIVRSSKRKLSDIFSGQCMASSFFVSYDKIEDIPNSTKTGNKRVEKLKSNDDDSCKYLLDGICRNKKSTNYTYLCERPLNCKYKRR